MVSMTRSPDALDHILLGCKDLDAGIALMEQRTGVRAQYGGVHPGLVGEVRHQALLPRLDDDSPEARDQTDSTTNRSGSRRSVAMS